MPNSSNWLHEKYVLMMFAFVEQNLCYWSFRKANSSNCLLKTNEMWSMKTMMANATCVRPRWLEHDVRPLPWSTMIYHGMWFEDNVVPMLAQRRTRWPNIGTTLGRCLMFAGYCIRAAVYYWQTDSSTWDQMYATLHNVLRNKVEGEILLTNNKLIMMTLCITRPWLFTVVTHFNGNEITIRPGIYLI